MNWKIVVAVLCIYGFFKEFRPLEPFLTPYLRSDLKNFTDVQLYSRVYPVWTYSYLAALIPTFLLTDLLRYNAILIFGALLYGSTWLLLIFGSTIGQMQLMQFFYGSATATEVAYYAYAYAAVEPIHYKKATSYVRCVVESGRFCSYAFGQTLISTRAAAYMDLNYIALGGSILILLVALCLPCISWKRSLDRIRDVGEEEPRVMGEEESVPLRKSQPKKEDEAHESIGRKLSGQTAIGDKSIDHESTNRKLIGPELIDRKSIDHKSSDQESIDHKSISKKSTDPGIKHYQRTSSTGRVKSYGDFVRFYFANLWTTFKEIYSTRFMWKWSLWSALATCGMLQVTNYIQNLWDLVQTSEADVWNGIVEAINTFLAAVVVACLQFLTVRWEIWGECTLAIISIIDCALLVTMSQISSLVAIYVLYVAFRVLYETMFTVAMYNIAKDLPTESFGLVFGFNTFVALVLQTILTVAVADERGFALDIRNQFVVYGVYHGFISIIFFSIGVRTLLNHFRHSRSRSLVAETRIEEEAA